MTTCPHVIETAEQLDALPVGALLVDQWGTAWRIRSGGRVSLISRSRAIAPERIVLPGVLAWTPPAEGVQR